MGMLNVTQDFLNHNNYHHYTMVLCCKIITKVQMIDLCVKTYHFWIVPMPNDCV